MRRALDHVLPGTVVFVGVDPHYSVGPESWFERYRVACRHEVPALAGLEAEGVPLFCLEREVGAEALPGRATPDLLAHPRTLAFLEGLAAEAGSLSLLLFKPSAKVEGLALARGWRVLGATASLARRMENKLQFYRLLDGLGLPCPPWIEVDVDTTSYAALARSLGPHFVVQGAHGFSGSSTFDVPDEAAFQVAAVALRRRTARAAAFVGGAPLTLTGCVVDQGVVLVGRLFHQVTGAPQCTVHRLGACGNDWSASPPPEDLQEQARGVARRVGEELGQRGFRGIYGMDFVVADDGGGVLAIEVNPRLVSSVPMATVLEEEAGLVPLLAWHLLATSGVASPLGNWPELVPLLASWDHPAPLQGAQLVLHNLCGADARMTGRLETAVYRVDGSGLEWVRRGLRATEAGADEFLVLPGGTRHTLAQAGECARVQCRHALSAFPHGLVAGPGRLTGEALRVAGAVYDGLGVECLPAPQAQDASVHD